MASKLFDFDIDVNYIVFKEPLLELTNDIIPNDIREKTEGIIFEKCDQAINVIDSYSLSYFPNLKEIIFYRNVDFINSNAFLFNPLLEVVKFKNVGLIAHEAFYGCLSINEIEINYNTYTYPDSFDSCITIKKKNDKDNDVLDNKFIKNNIAYQPEDFVYREVCRKEKDKKRYFRIIAITSKARKKRFIIPSLSKEVKVITNSKAKFYMFHEYLRKPLYILSKDSFRCASSLKKKRPFLIEKNVEFIDKKILFNPKIFDELQFSHQIFNGIYPFPNITLKESPLSHRSNGYSYSTFLEYDSIKNNSKHLRISDKYYSEGLKNSPNDKEYFLMGAYLGNLQCAQVLYNNGFFKKEEINKIFNLEVSEKTKEKFDKDKAKAEKEEINKLIEKNELESKKSLEKTLRSLQKSLEKDEFIRNEIFSEKYYFLHPEVIKKFCFSNSELLNSLKDATSKDKFDKVIFEYCKKNKFSSLDFSKLDERDITLFYIDLYDYDRTHENVFASYFYKYIKSNKDFALFIDMVRKDMELAKKYYYTFLELKQYFDKAEIKYKNKLDLILYDIKCSGSLAFKIHRNKIDNLVDAWKIIENEYVISSSSTEKDILTVLFTYIKYLNEMNLLVKEDEYINTLVYYGMKAIQKIKPSSDSFELFRYIEEFFFESKYKDIGYYFIKYFDGQYLDSKSFEVNISSSRHKNLRLAFNKAVLVNKKKIVGTITDEDIYTFGTEEEIIELKQRRENERIAKAREEEQKRLAREAQERELARQAEEKRKAELAAMKAKTDAINKASSNDDSSSKATMIDGRTLESYFDDVISPFPPEVIKDDNSENIDIIGESKDSADKRFLGEMYWDYWKEGDYRNAFYCQKYLRNDYRLGLHYYYGLGVKKDIKKAFSHLQTRYFNIQAKREYSWSSSYQELAKEIKEILCKINSVYEMAYYARSSGNEKSVSDFVSHELNSIEMMYSKTFSTYGYQSFGVYIDITASHNFVEDIKGNKFVPSVTAHVYPSEIYKDNWRFVFSGTTAKDALKSTMNDAAWNSSYLDDAYKYSKEYRDAVDTINIRKNRADEIDEYNAREKMKDAFTAYGLEYVKKCYDELPKGTYFTITLGELQHSGMIIDKKIIKELGSTYKLPIRTFNVKFHYVFK